MKKYEKIRKYDSNIWGAVGGDFGVDCWVHNYYRFKNKMVSVYSDNAFSDDFSIAIFKIKDLRKKHNWYDEITLERNHVTMNDVVDIIELVEHGKI